MASCSVLRLPGFVRVACTLQTHRRFKMTMFNKVTKTFQWGQHTVTMETGEIAR
jgi:hypothetical protein